MKRPDSVHHPAPDGVIRLVHWGDTVRIHVLVWLKDGTLLGSSSLGGPLTFTTGEQAVMQGIEELVIGMAVGESKTEMMATDRAFGPSSSDSISHAPDRHPRLRLAGQTLILQLELLDILDPVPQSVTKPSPWPGALRT
ncbi:FKBP-type peptidyl-prolyl cis-trans isomerase [Nitrospira lenta]|uniref:Peptidyl-prolyl cis-trans isomerase n=1 Tax=Nitrospira lenta TaxID=1436998 RepID=A0A330L7Z0_9BACT|nr:FKBP-type peptidyl-prolyl cis-trans isomerase [Nitrospira lenta]SPP65233.1 hypothetical protein NITLEN_30147 [Nitrospira lenta]